MQVMRNTLDTTPVPSDWFVLAKTGPRLGRVPGGAIPHLRLDRDDAFATAVLGPSS
jgi:hypothetical protein